jgi:hypothetical protein
MRLVPALCLALFLAPGCTHVPETAETHEAPAVGAEGLWVMQIRRQEWKPRDLEFVLQLEADGTGRAALDPVFIGRTTATVEAYEERPDGHVAFRLHSPHDGIDYRVTAHRVGDTLEGTVSWATNKLPPTVHNEPFIAHRRQVRRFGDRLEGLPQPRETDPAAVGLDPVLLDRMVLGAEESRSDAFLVLSNGKVVAGRLFGRSETPIDFPHVTPIDRPEPRQVAISGQQLAEDGRPPDVLVAAHDNTAWQVRPEPSTDPGPPIGLMVHSGDQYLLVYPQDNVVVVRMVSRVPTAIDARYNKRDAFEWLPEMADALVMDKRRRTTAQP